MKKEVFPFINPLLKNKKFLHNKKPYLKKLKKIAGFDVWIVDGKYIRDKICEDFVNLGQHYFLKLIPKNEFWISKEANQDENNFYIEHLLIENRLMKRGFSYDKAYMIAAAAEKRERMRSKLAKNLKKIKSEKSLIERVHKKLLKKTDKIKIWLVNGEIIRDRLFIGFGGGGHDRVYNFIPEKEIWIDDAIPSNERNFIMIHEMRERILMGGKMRYSEAHYEATELEDFSRKHKKEVEKTIKNLIENQ